MSPSDDVTPEKLEELHRRCMALGKQSLYDLVGAPGGPSIRHEDLQALLRKKSSAWGKMAGKAAEVDLVELALKLTKKAEHKVQYDAILRETAEPPASRPVEPPSEPQPSNRQPWQYEQPTPRPQYRQRPAAPMSGTTVLVLAGIGLVTLSFLLRPLDSWLDRLASSLGGTESSEQSSPGPTQGRAELPDESEQESVPPHGEGPSPQSRGTSTDVAESTRVDPPPPLPRSAPSPPPASSPPPAPSPRPVPSPSPPPSPPPEPPSSPAPPSPPEPPPPPEPIDEPVRVADVPRQTWRVDPVYPPLQRLRRTEGFVILQVTVDREGDVSDVSVLRSDVDAFAEPAVSAVRQWRYEPTVIDGRPVSVVFTFTLFFRP